MTESSRQQSDRITLTIHTAIKFLSADARANLRAGKPDQEVQRALRGLVLIFAETISYENLYDRAQAVVREEADREGP